MEIRNLRKRNNIKDKAEDKKDSFKIDKSVLKTVKLNLRKISKQDMNRINNLREIKVYTCIDPKEDNSRFFSSSTADSFQILSKRDHIHPDLIDEDNDSVSSDSDSENEIDLNIILGKCQQLGISLTMYFIILEFLKYDFYQKALRN